MWRGGDVECGVGGGGRESLDEGTERFYKPQDLAVCCETVCY